jgi:hypothetical protein
MILCFQLVFIVLLFVLLIYLHFGDRVNNAPGLHDEPAKSFIDSKANSQIAYDQMVDPLANASTFREEITDRKRMIGRIADEQTNPSVNLVYSCEKWGIPENVRHGGSPCFENVRRAVIKYYQPIVVVGSRRWVRYAGVFPHACISLYMGLLELLDFLRLCSQHINFIMRFGRVLQIKLNRAQNLRIHRAAVLLCRLFDVFAKFFISIEDNVYRSHNTNIVQILYFVNTPISSRLQYV